MSELVQWILVGIAVAISAFYLVRRLSRRTKVGECGGSCSSCPMGDDGAQNCEEKPRDGSV